MRVLAFDSSLCTGCYTCEETCSRTWFKVGDRALSSIQILEPQDGGSYQAVICTQCGQCIDVCPTRALSRAQNGVVRRDMALCVGCLACVGFCPVAAPNGDAAMRAHPAIVEPFKCVACGSCSRACLEGALEVITVEDAPPTATERFARRAEEAR